MTKTKKLAVAGTSRVVDADGVVWLWAGRVDGSEGSAATRRCERLVKLGVLAPAEQEDGYFVFRLVTSESSLTALPALPALYFVNDSTAGPLCWFSSRREAQKASVDLRRVCGWTCPVEVKPLDLLPQDEVERLATLDGADASVRRVAAREIAARARKGGSFRSLEQWTEVYGSAERAREAGVTGRLAEVCDGEYTWLRSTRRRSIAAVREEFLATADYAEIPALVIRIVPAV